MRDCLRCVRPRLLHYCLLSECIQSCVAIFGKRVLVSFVTVWTAAVFLRRLVRSTRWLSLVVVTIQLVALPASLWWELEYAGDGFAITLWAGTVSYSKSTIGQVWPQEIGLRMVARSRWPTIGSWLDYGHHSIAGYSTTWFPAWLPFLGTMLWVFVAWKTERRQLAAICHICGYDLRGCSDSRCSECGTAVKSQIALEPIP